jgi:hypothetical protein
VAEPKRSEQLAQSIGVASVDGHTLAQAVLRLPGEAQLEAALADSSQAQLVVLAMLIEKGRPFSGQQRQLVAEAFGTEAAQQVDAYHEAIERLPPGLRLPLLDRAGPTLLKLAPAVRERLLLLVHGLILADGRVTLHEFLLFTVLRRRIGRDASGPAPVRFMSLVPVQAEVGLVMSLLASVRLPEHPERAYNAGLLLLAGIEPPRVPTEAIDLDAVAGALDRLNQLAPLVKPRLIKACTAVAFVDGETHWKAASCLRTVCAALDAPLPPQLRDDAGASGGTEADRGGRQLVAGQLSLPQLP